MSSSRQLLQEVARQAMVDRGFEPDFSSAADRQAESLRPAAAVPEARDLRELPWCSIDNDDSRDLDQLSVALPPTSTGQPILVAVADVAAVVLRDTPIDQHAARNTTSVYTGVEVFPMLPVHLSTDLTSLNDGEDRAALVVELTVDANGSVAAADVYPALVHNRAKLAYSSVGPWFEGKGPMPAPVAAVAGLEQNLRQQDAAAQALKQRRHENGALTLAVTQPRAVFDDGSVRDVTEQEHNRASELIEDFMIAANGVVARFLAARGVASLRRVVRDPERWPRLVALAARSGDTLPEKPDAAALEQWLLRRRAAAPAQFPELSLSVIKLLGRGEYAVERAGEEAPGHFGLAVHDYSHSTAPNRRFPDLVTQRLLKAAIAQQPQPYSDAELADIARHCTEREDAANKVERQTRKAAAAVLLASRVGERFDGIVTGASAKGTWVRIAHPSAEGRVEQGAAGLEVGDKVSVRLLRTDPRRGFIDFARA